MTLEEIQNLAVCQVDTIDPDAGVLVADVLAEAVLLMLPVVKAAEAWHDRQCTGEHQLCRETVDLHAQECAIEAREFDLYDAIDAMRTRMGEK